MSTPEERVNITISESDRLKEYLTSLPADSMNQPSACDRWKVQDVVAHMAWVAEAYINRIHESLDDGSPIGSGREAPGPVSSIDFRDSNAQNGISRREGLGEQVLSDFISKNDELIQLMKGFSPQDWDKPHYYSSLGSEAAGNGSRGGIKHLADRYVAIGSFFRIARSQ